VHSELLATCRKTYCSLQEYGQVSGQKTIAGRGRSGQIGGPDSDSEEGAEVAFSDAFDVGSDGFWVVGVPLITAVGLALVELLSSVATQLLMSKT